METLFSPSLYHRNRYLPIDGLESESQKIASCSRSADHFIRSHQKSAKVTPPRHQELSNYLKTGALVVDFLAPPLTGMAVFAAISGFEEYLHQSGDPSCPVNWEKVAKTIVWGMTADMAGLAALAVLGKTGKTVHTLENLAATCPVVQRGLMQLSHATYFMRMKNVLNPDSRELKIVYSCMGADVSTVLMATNARRVSGIDLHKIDPDFLRHYMSKTGEELLTDGYSPRHSPIDPDYLLHGLMEMRRKVIEKTRIRDDYFDNYDNYDYSWFSPQDHQRGILDNIMRIRQKDGYWYDYYIRTDHIDPERLIAIEL